MDYCMFMLLLGLLDSHCVRCLFVTDIVVPPIVDFRDNVTLSCSYEISGHTLNSVKWYKDKMEFFRYSPLMHPVYMKFPVNGIQLTNDKNFCNESTCRIELALLGSQSSGVYRCEVSGDAPHFKLTARSANMTVAALPQNNPLIVSFHPVYRYDDFVHVNCSTDFSSLQARLSWFINGVKASFADLQPGIETTIPAHEYYLRRQILPLNFYANDPRFHNSDKNNNNRHNGAAGRVLALRCVAEIEQYPALRRETKLNATLLRNEDLKNQKLVNSAATTNAALQVLLLLLLAITFTTIDFSSQRTHSSSQTKSQRVGTNHS